MVFNHSVKVPTQYKRAALIFKKAINEKKSVKSLVYEEKHAKIPNLVALLNKYSQNKDAIETVLEELEILKENPRLDEYICRVLVTELIYGPQKLNGQSKPVLVVLSYHEKLKKAFAKLQNSETSTNRIIKPRYVRVNTNLYSVREALEYLTSENFKQIECEVTNYEAYMQAIRDLEDDQFLIDIHVPELFVFHTKTHAYWANHELTIQKKVILQDRGTCIVGKLLDPRPNSIVLDMCAAPGMKSLHMANIMNNTGTIFAIEKNCERFNTLAEIVESANASKTIQPVNCDAFHLTDYDYPGVEYILVDPSCSGSGMQNRLSLSKGREEKDPDRLQKLSGLQINLLQLAMKEFPNVKRIAYSTCSIYEEENEQVVQKCLERCPEFKLLNGKKALRRVWKNTGNVKYEGIGKNCLYSLPEDDLTDGIFVAIFEKRQVAND